MDLPEHLVLFIAVGRFQLLLDKPRPMLVAAEFDNVIENVLRKPQQLPIRTWRRPYLQLISFVGLAVVPEFFQQRASHVLTDVVLPRRSSRNGRRCEQGGDRRHLIIGSERVHPQRPMRVKVIWAKGDPEVHRVRGGWKSGRFWQHLMGAPSVPIERGRLPVGHAVEGMIAFGGPMVDRRLGSGRRGAAGGVKLAMGRAMGVVGFGRWGVRGAEGR